MLHEPTLQLEYVSRINQISHLVMCLAPVKLPCNCRKWYVSLTNQIAALGYVFPPQSYH